MVWSGAYEGRTRELAQAPVYCVVVFEARTMLGVTLSYTGDLIEGDTGDTLVLRDRAEKLPIMVYDTEGFELMRGVYASATNEFTDVDRAQFGTTLRYPSFAAGSVVAVPWLCYTTEQIDGGLFQSGMSFPSGGGQDMDLVEGHTRTSAVTVDVLDTDGRITREMFARTAIGKTAVVLGGYRDLPFDQFVMLHAGPITAVRIVQGMSYEFEIDTVMVKLKRKLFHDVAAFSTTLSGNMTDVQTTLPLADPTQVYDSGETNIGLKPGLPVAAANAWKAAMYFKVGSTNEIMRHESGMSPQNVVRGALGTTATAHTTGATVDMAFVVEGNPIDILIGLLVTRDPGYQGRFLPHAGLGYYDFWNTVDTNKGALGLHLETGDIDLEAFETIRDDWYPRYFGRMAFARETDMETTLRERILKPLGLNFYVNRAGKLSLAILRPPLAGVPVTLDAGSIVGVPDLEFTNEEIVNEVRVEYDHDYFSDESVTDLTVIDATSKSVYDRSGDCTLEPSWLRADLRGDTLAPRLARKKMRHHRDPNPTMPLDVLYTKVATDIAGVVHVTMPTYPSPQDGVIGFDRTMLVVGRRVDWQQGALSFDLINTAYIGRRYGLIAPSGTADYSSATAAETAAYVFIADGTTETMSDGTDAYKIM